MNTFGLIFLTIAILMFIIPITASIMLRDGKWLLLCIVSLFAVMLFAVANYPDPTDNDIKEGKAIYVENKHVELTTQGDTLSTYSTYQKVWLPEWKWGRKQK